ncbi:MAG: hypothetical protein M1820_003256 [Bogoriella megaspora]|nr:MAG: hypothetical protein M1820_003256 [Bogoriella megaspora]
MALEPRSTTLPAPYVVPPSQQFDGAKGNWSTFSISVGTPGQDFRVLVSTAASDIWIPVAEGCTEYDVGNCPSLRGVELFNGNQNPGFQSNDSSTWSLLGLYAVGTEAHLNISGNGLTGYDSVAFGISQDNTALAVNNTVVAAIPDKDIFLGSIGLGNQPLSLSSSSDPKDSFLQSLKKANMIPSLSYGYTAGNTYRLKKVEGSLILGGYDSTRFTPNDLTFTFSSDDSAPLQVGVQSIITSDSLQGVTSFTSTGHLSVIDTTVEELWLPQDVCDSMADAFGLIFDPGSHLYVLNTTIHNQLLQKNPNITIQLGNTAYNNGKSINIILPYAAFDMTVGWPIYNSSYNYFPIRRAANDSQYTIGRTLLQEAYLIVDHEHENFTISQAAFPDPLPSAQIQTIQPSGGASSNSETLTSSHKSGLGTGAIAGIAVGVVVVLAFAVLAVFFFLRRRRRSHQPLPPNGGIGVQDDDGSNAGSHERKNALLGYYGTQELGSNDVNEMDGNSWARAELAASKPGEVRNGTRPMVYEMPTSNTGSGTWSTPRGSTPVTGSWSNGQPSPGWGTWGNASQISSPYGTVSSDYASGLFEDAQGELINQRVTSLGSNLSRLRILASYGFRPKETVTQDSHHLPWYQNRYIGTTDRYTSPKPAAMKEQQEHKTSNAHSSPPSRGWIAESIWEIWNCRKIIFRKNALLGQTIEGAESPWTVAMQCDNNGPNFGKLNEMVRDPGHEAVTGDRAGDNRAWGKMDRSSGLYSVSLILQLSQS